MNMSGIRTLFGDGYEGAPRFAPFDKIIVTAGASRLPDKLIQQLKIGGSMVIPMHNGVKQEMIRFVKKSEASVIKENHGSCAFVPMLDGIQ